MADQHLSSSISPAEPLVRARTQDVFFSQIWKSPCFVKLDLYNLPLLVYCRKLLLKVAYFQASYI